MEENQVKLHHRVTRVEFHLLTHICLSDYLSL